MKHLVHYFLRGVLVILPITATFLILAAAVRFIDTLIPLPVPGLGFIVVILGTIIVGFFASRLIVRPFIDWLERLLKQAPIINFLYSSVKDFLEAFLGSKRKFDVPVLVKTSDLAFYKIGFMTQKSLSELGLSEHAAVYFPHSYNFSGELFLVPVAQIKEISQSPTETMRYIVSGGVISFPKESPASRAGSRERATDT